MWPVKYVENIYWAISNEKVACPCITQTEVYRMQRKLECIAQFAANSPKSQCFMSKQLGLLLLDTCKQFQLELRSHIQQAIADGKRIAKGLHFPVVYQMINSGLKAF